MTYYPTLAEDLARAREIVTKGRVVFCTRHCATPTRDPDHEHPAVCVCGGYLTDGGTIFGLDIYAAYKLLASFVAEIEELRLTQRMLAATIRNIVVAVCGDDTWEGTVKEGVELLNRRFLEANAAIEAAATRQR